MNFKKLIEVICNDRFRTSSCRHRQHLNVENIKTVRNTCEIHKNNEAPVGTRKWHFRTSKKWTVIGFRNTEKQQKTYTLIANIYKQLTAIYALLVESSGVIEAATKKLGNVTNENKKKWKWIRHTLRKPTTNIAR